jgi:hypothetical protein
MENYVRDKYGLHQIKKEKFIKDYGAERNNYGELSNYLSYLRLGILLGVIPDVNESLLDVGFGNGDFLRVSSKYFKNIYGFDLDYKYLPTCAIKEENLYNNYYDIITFFDSLEHFDILPNLSKLNCQYLFISVPNCKYLNDIEWFNSWKHKRPNEHLHHFNFSALYNLLDDNNYDMIYHSYFEDVIRKSIEPDNILSIIAKKR